MSKCECRDCIHYEVCEYKGDMLCDYFKDKSLCAEYVVDGDFKFEYGIVVYKHRFSLNRSLDDYKETTLNKCIRMGIQYKYKTVACDKLIAEMQIVYKDENNKLRCLCEDLHEYTFEIKHKGNMQINI